jgi:hypothetical protein
MDTLLTAPVVWARDVLIALNRLARPLGSRPSQWSWKRTRLWDMPRQLCGEPAAVETTQISRGITGPVQQPAYQYVTRDPVAPNQSTSSSDRLKRLVET